MSKVFKGTEKKEKTKLPEESERKNTHMNACASRHSLVVLHNTSVNKRSLIVNYPLQEQGHIILKIKTKGEIDLKNTLVEVHKS